MKSSYSKAFSLLNFYCIFLSSLSRSRDWNVNKIKFIIKTKISKREGPIVKKIKILGPIYCFTTLTCFLHNMSKRFCCRRTSRPAVWAQASLTTQMSFQSSLANVDQTLAHSKTARMVSRANELAPSFCHPRRHRVAAIFSAASLYPISQTCIILLACCCVHC